MSTPLSGRSNNDCFEQPRPVLLPWQHSELPPWQKRHGRSALWWLLALLALLALALPACSPGHASSRPKDAAREWLRLRDLQGLIYRSCLSDRMPSVLQHGLTLFDRPYAAAKWLGPNTGQIAHHDRHVSTFWAYIVFLSCRVIDGKPDWQNEQLGGNSRLAKAW